MIRKVLAREKYRRPKWNLKNISRQLQKKQRTKGDPKYAIFYNRMKSVLQKEYNRDYELIYFKDLRRIKEERWRVDWHDEDEPKITYSMFQKLQKELPFLSLMDANALKKKKARDEAAKGKAKD